MDGGANERSLNQAREWWTQMSPKDLVEFYRPPHKCVDRDYGPEVKKGDMTIDEAVRQILDIYPAGDGESLRKQLLAFLEERD